MMSPRPLPTVCLAVLLVSAACVPDKGYRIDRSVGYEELTPAEFDPTQTGAIAVPFQYRLGFVEFSDKGEVYGQELEAARNLIRDTKRTAPPGAPPIVLVFVHGWKNNASDASGNVWGFRQVLAAMSLQYRSSGNPIVGIYVGWRGAVVNAPIVEQFTFFDRHAKSQHLPGTVDAIRQIMAEAKSGTPATSVLIGHSFGGAVLEDAVTPTITEEILAARREQRRVVWPADLIMFLNEAQEAEKSYPLIGSMTSNLAERNACVPRGGKGSNQRPAVISISSTGDIATRAYFPGGQVVGLLLFQRPSYHGADPLGVGGAAPLYLSTTAHLAAFRSHVLGTPHDPDVVDAEKACEPYMHITLPFSADSSTGPTDVAYDIVERPGAKNRTPYWVLHMPPSIVPDHSTIFTQTFRDFLVTLIYQALFNDPQDRPLPNAAR